VAPRAEQIVHEPPDIGRSFDEHERHDADAQSERDPDPARTLHPEQPTHRMSRTVAPPKAAGPATPQIPTASRRLRARSIIPHRANAIVATTLTTIRVSFEGLSSPG
jgi:hypothetical protein